MTEKLPKLRSARCCGTCAHWVRDWDCGECGKYRDPKHPSFGLSTDCDKVCSAWEKEARE